MSSIAEGTESSMVRVGDETSSKPRMQYRGLRGWLEQVDKLGELRKVDGAHWDVEMGAITPYAHGERAAAPRPRSCSTMCRAIRKATARSTGSSPPSVASP